jgi:hypothetical protein
VDDLTTLRDTWGRPQSPSVAAYSTARAALLQRAASETTASVHELRPAARPGRGRGYRRRAGRGAVAAAAGIAAVAAAAAVITLWPAAPGTRSPGTVTAENAGSPATQLLAKIATAAGDQPAPRVSDSEFEYVKTEVAYTLRKPSKREVWQSVSNSCAAGLLIADGIRTPLPAQATCLSREGNLNAPTYRLLESLPTDPRALLNLIYSQVAAGHKGKAIDKNAYAFGTIGDLLNEQILPPKTSETLYRAAALIPGVTVFADQPDAVGRRGTAIGRETVSGGQKYINEWIFNKSTLQYMGQRDFNVRTGAVSAETAVVQTAFVSHVGQRP